MIGKLLGMLMTFIAAVCVATVISAAALIFYYVQSWKVTKERAGQAMAILQGTSPEALLPPPLPKKQNDSEQPGYEKFVAEHDLERLKADQRETMILALIRQFQDQLDKAEVERKRVQAVSDDLQAKLDEMKNSANDAGMATVQDTMEKIKPKQAKELIVQRLDKGEIDVVAKMLANMSDGKRAKIIAEFKTPDDMDKIGAVLNRIRQGQPATDLADETEKKMQPPKRPGTSAPEGLN
jgi:hypothetical protein